MNRNLQVTLWSLTVATAGNTVAIFFLALAIR